MHYFFFKASLVVVILQFAGQLGHIVVVTFQIIMDRVFVSVSMSGSKYCKSGLELKYGAGERELARLSGPSMICNMGGCGGDDINNKEKRSSRASCSFSSELNVRRSDVAPGREMLPGY